MISFISSGIDKPWTDRDVLDFENNGSQRDTIQYNSYYNWRLKLTDKNTFLCSLKTNNGDYKNIYLFAVTRRLFYFVIFIPQLEVLKKIRNNQQITPILSLLPLTSKCLESENHEVSITQDILSLDCGCLLVKVNAPIDSFLFPRNKCISNNEIKQKYALLNKLYFQIDKEYECLGEIIGKYNRAIENKLDEQKEKLKRILVRKGVRMGISIALAGITGGLSIGLDALFDLEEIADIYDVMDIADIYDMSDMMVDAADMMDIAEMTDYADLDFDTLENAGLTDNLLYEETDLSTYSDGISNIEDGGSPYNVSFQASENSDGFIPDGKIELERTVSGHKDSFPHYTKDGHDYVKVGSSYIRVDVGQTVTIGNVKYDTV